MNDKIDLIATILLIIGGLNWALFAFGFNLVELISFGVGAVATVVYLLVGISAVVKIIKLTA